MMARGILAETLRKGVSRISAERRYNMTIRIKNADEFKRQLMKIGHTQETYADKMGISFSHLNKAINGKKNVGAKLAHKMQKDLKVKFENLFIIETEDK